MLSDLEVLPAVQLLTHRYALAIDSRDLELMASLFSPRATFGRHGDGADGARAFFSGVWTRFRRSIHRVSNQIVDVDSALSAHGTAYCRAEQEQLDGSWETLSLAYFDDYVVEDGRWLFAARRVELWYREPVAHPVRTGPMRGVPTSGIGLPQSWPSWEEFWSGR